VAGNCVQPLDPKPFIFLHLLPLRLAPTANRVFDGFFTHCCSSGITITFLRSSLNLFRNRSFSSSKRCCVALAWCTEVGGRPNGKIASKSSLTSGGKAKLLTIRVQQRYGTNGTSSLPVITLISEGQ
jgi:hypothetical protein